MPAQQRIEPCRRFSPRDHQTKRQPGKPLAISKGATQEKAPPIAGPSLGGMPRQRSGILLAESPSREGCRNVTPPPENTGWMFWPVLAGFAANPATHHSESATGHSGAGQSSRRGGPRRLMVSAGRGRSSPGVTPRRVYPALPERLRYVGPYQAGRDRHSTADRRAGEFGH